MLQRHHRDSVLPEHEIVYGKYHIIRKVGEGGMGDVYLAVDTQGKRFALKIIKTTFKDDDALERFFREVRATIRLVHPNIVPVYDWGIHKDKPFCAMEFLDGKDLSRTLRDKDGRLSWEQLKPLLLQICDALRTAHEQQIIHRDLKPGNIFIVDGGNVKIIDFGLAKQLGTTGDGLTKTGMVAGTPEYMAPEQLRGDPYDHRADIYAVGVIMYKMLCGKLPFEHEALIQLGQMILNEAPVAPRERNPDIPVEVESIVLRLLQKEPEYRFQTIEELEEAIDNAETVMEAADGRGAAWSYRPPPISAETRMIENNGEARNGAFEDFEAEKRKPWKRKLAVVCAVVAALGGAGYHFREQLRPYMDEVIRLVEPEREKLEPKLKEKLKELVPEERVRKEFQATIKTGHEGGVRVILVQKGEELEKGIAFPHKPLKLKLKDGDVLYFKKKRHKQQRKVVSSKEPEITVTLNPSERFQYRQGNGF